MELSTETLQFNQFDPMSVHPLAELGGLSLDAIRLVALVQRYPVDVFPVAAVLGVWKPWRRRQRNVGRSHA
jgi:hypothetical protein